MGSGTFSMPIIMLKYRFIHIITPQTVGFTTWVSGQYERLSPPARPSVSACSAAPSAPASPPSSLGRPAGGTGEWWEWRPPRSAWRNLSWTKTESGACSEQRCSRSKSLKYVCRKRKYFCLSEPLSGFALAWTILADSYHTISPSFRVTSCRCPAWS